MDLDAVRANTAALVRHAAQGTEGPAQVMAVVKADGYGHGMLPCARAALEGGATWLGVATADEALELRAAGITAPVLCWLHAPGEPFRALVEAGVDVSVSSLEQLAEVSAAAAQAAAPAHVHLKIDTGLGRNGATAADWAGLCAAASRAEDESRVVVVGVWSHFAHADAPTHPTTDAQVQAFRAAVEVAKDQGLRPTLRHLANSAATLTRPDTHFDLVRPGLAVYGLSPVPDVAGPQGYGLRPAATVAARVALTKRVPAGTGVSYGHRHTTAAETTLALVPLGYADGVPRSATSTAQVSLGGARHTIAGTVCMDQFVLDVGDQPVTAGDEVLLLGPGDAGEPTAEEWARALGTISYEIVTRLGPRLPRTYVGGSA